MKPLMVWAPVPINGIQLRPIQFISETTSGIMVSDDEKLPCPFCFGERCGKARCTLCGMQTSGKVLKEKWSIPAEQVRFHRDGHWFQNPTLYPAAFSSPSGYIVFQNQDDLLNCEGIEVGDRSNVSGGKTISSLAGFITANLQPLGEVIEKEPLGPEGYVYAIINPSFNGWIKVGCASDYDTRLKNYQTGDPHRAYEKIHHRYFSDRVQAEALAHNELKKLTSKWNGEWFYLREKQVISIIDSIP